VSRTGRTEYQLLLMKASDRGRNVKFLGNNLGCVLSKLPNNYIKDVDTEALRLHLIYSIDVTRLNCILICVEN